jgi:hypothetical protein
LQGPEMVPVVELLGKATVQARLQAADAIV